MTAVSYQVSIAGCVQGQGVRPALAHLANDQGWTGQVSNTSQGVALTLHHVALDATRLEQRLRSAHPALSSAAIRITTANVAAASPSVPFDFRIVTSTAAGPTSVPVPLDIGICPECLAEFQSSDNRRQRHPLISCTRCGPRFSIIQALPYDRARTTLQNFPLCAACEAEYRSATDRRSHAQTVSCCHCGPQVWASDRTGRRAATGDAACQAAAAVLRAGQILALRGIGGYQLLVDATSTPAVSRLRDRKHRPTKPLAVLCRNLDEAAAWGELDSLSRELLTSPANPIVIVPRRFDRDLAAGIHPGLNDIGLMLPTTAVHDRLLELTGRPLVCTSGNLEGAPLVVDVAESLTALSAIADFWLHHDRPIYYGLDDSVIRPMAGRAVTLRCARGLAPLSLSLPTPLPVLALGGFQKSAIAWSNGAQAALGPHIGDLSDLQTRDRWQTSVAQLQELYRLQPEIVAIDGHPDDVTRQLAPRGCRPVTVWHHHAHIVAGMVEQGWLHAAVIGIAADGHGYGPDGTLWGGEVLDVTATGFQRLAALRAYALPGGEAAIREPARLAVALLSQLPELTPPGIAAAAGMTSARVSGLQTVIRLPATPRTSSLGRLFDAISWIVLGPQSPGYLGEPGARLEAVCDPAATGCYRWPIDDRQNIWEIDWRPMLRQVLQDQQRDVPVGIIAERFHRGVAGWMRDVYQRCPPRPLVVSGGVFQNRRLCELLAADWPAHGPPLGLPGQIPPGDGGLAVGQMAIATMRWASGTERNKERDRG